MVIAFSKELLSGEILNVTIGPCWHNTLNNSVICETLAHIKVEWCIYWSELCWFVLNSHCHANAAEPQGIYETVRFGLIA